jgi:hypothetical protein
VLARVIRHAETSGVDDNPREKGSRLAESVMGSSLSGNSGKSRWPTCENGYRFAALQHDMAGSG